MMIISHCIRNPSTPPHTTPIPSPHPNTIDRASVHRPSLTPRPTLLELHYRYIQHIMDSASAIVGIVSFGFVVFSKANDLRKAIKDAPDRVQALQDSCVVVTLLLSKLQVSGGHNALSCSPEGDRYLQALCEKANVCLMDVDAAVKKVRVVSIGNINGRTRKLRLHWRKWVANKGKLNDLEKKMMELRKALCEMLDFLRT